MNKYRREANAAFTNPVKAKRKVDLADVFTTIEKVFQENVS